MLGAPQGTETPLAALGKLSVVERSASFVASFLEEGVLHFKVSCGHQLITFSDPKHRLDSGHQHTLELSVTVAEEGDGHTCRV